MITNPLHPPPTTVATKTNRNDDRINVPLTTTILNGKKNFSLLSSKDEELKPECHLLLQNPLELAQIPSGPEKDRKDDALYKGPRLIKTEKFAQVLQREWINECYNGNSSIAKPNCQKKSRIDNMTHTSSIGKPFLYKDPKTYETYYGHLVYPPDMKENEVLPGMIMLQTGAGNHDLYYRWKADAWARGIHNGVHTGCRCVVFIPDIFSDDRGWGWDNDKTYYGTVRKDILEPNETTGVREKLRDRLNLIVNTFKSIPHVDECKIGVFGWCFGGHAICELARMGLPGIKCLASFHGVWDGIEKTKIEEVCSNEAVTAKDEGNMNNKYSGGGDCCTTNNHVMNPLSDSSVSQPEGNDDTTSSSSLQVLICHGQNDIISPNENHDIFKKQLDLLYPRVKYTSMEFGPGVYHGFTNPAHRYHPSPNKFSYNEEEAFIALTAACNMFKRTCFSTGNEQNTVNTERGLLVL